MTIIATVSVKTTDEIFLQRILQCKKNSIDVIRFNLSKINDSEYNWFSDKCKQVRELINDINIAFDLPIPGMKPRFFLTQPSLRLLEGECISFYNNEFNGNYFNVSNFLEYYRKDEPYYYEDGAGILSVEYISNNKIVFKSHNTFELCSGKSLPGSRVVCDACTRECIDLISNVRPEQLWFSFVENAMCERELLSYVNYQPSIFYKIETLKGLQNIDQILNNSNANVVAARGDLGLALRYNLLKAQYSLLKTARRYNRIAYVGTDFLKSMRTCSIPSRLDMIDLQLAINMNYDGIMLNVSNMINNFSRQIKYIRQCENTSNTINN